MTKHPETLNSSQLLSGVEAEVKRCMNLLMRIEEEVLPLVSHPIAPTLRAAMQDIDLLSQCLDDIARCISGITAADGAPRALNAEEILSKLRLQDMRLRLEGGSYDARKLTEREEIFDTPKPAPTVDVHLF